MLEAKFSARGTILRDAGNFRKCIWPGHHQEHIMGEECMLSHHYFLCVALVCHEVNSRPSPYTTATCVF